MKVAIVHDYLNQYGGAERVLQVLCALFPHAPVYTLVYDERATGGVFAGKTIRTSFLQRLPGSSRYHFAYTALMPLAVEQWDLRSFDLVISISASFAKGVILSPGTRHLAYCLTPPRFLWDQSQRFIGEFRAAGAFRLFVPPLLTWLRIWDHAAAQRPDCMLAISSFVAHRAQAYWQRDVPVVYPPVNIAKFPCTRQHDGGDYFLAVGRLVPYKRFDVVVDACTRARLPLVVVGDGPERHRLERRAGPTVRFVGRVDDAELARLYSGARAVLFPQEEDFGLVPLEAMACGTPVIAFRGGGVLETVIDRVTGLFFDEQTPEALLHAIERMASQRFHPELCRRQAERFDVPVFRERILAEVEACMASPL